MPSVHGDFDSMTAIVTESGYGKGISYYKGNGWLLLLEEPISIAFTLARQTAFKLVIIIFVSITLTAVIILLLLFRITVSPIKELTEITKEITQGNLNKVALVRTKDEVGQLADSLNIMTARLKNSYEKLKKANKQLVKTEKMVALGRMSATMAHELRNPLGVIKLAIYSLRKKLSPIKPDLVNHLNNIDKEVDASEKIIHDLLLFAKSPKVSVKLVDINKIILASLELLGSQIQENNIVVIQNLDLSMPEIKADSSLTIEVFYNIIFNAIQAMVESSKKELRISSRIKADFIEIEIADTGSGISKKNLSKLGEPFFSTKTKGIGLGLFIAYQLVEKHHGLIGAESEEGKGTVFIIKLPIKYDE